MFGLRRYRLFLLVAALSAASIFYLSTRGSWDVADLERIGQNAFKHESPQVPAVNDPVVPPSDALARPNDQVQPEKPAVVETSSQIAAQSSTRGKLDHESTSTRKPTTPTITGEEFLKDLPTFEDEFGDEGSGRLEVDENLNDGKRARWQKPPSHFPLPQQEIIAIPSTGNHKLPKIQATFGRESSSAKRDRISKLNTIKESFKHAWNGYKQYGMPHDEVKPVSKGFGDPFMGWGATLVDTLDTLWIMGLKSDFEEALAEVEKIDFTTSIRKDIPLFETVIRYLGGLLAAYELTEYKYPMLLNKTEELAEILMGSFDTPNRMPMVFYNWAPSYTSQPHRASAHTTMAELGSLSVEMTRLAQITGKHEYYDAIARITDELEKWQPNTLVPGLWPLKLDASGCKKTERPVVEDEDELPVLVDSDEIDLNDEEPAAYEGPGSNHAKRRVPPKMPKLQDKNKPQGPLQEMEQDILKVECTPQGLAAEPNAKHQTYGIGGQADSTYEYFPKMHALLKGRTEQYATMYKASAKAIRDKLLFRPMIKDEKRKILFAAKHELNPKAKTKSKQEKIVYEVTHLSCFAGGMFGLGAKLFGISEDLELAKQLTDGCVWAYESMPTEIMAESAALVPCADLDVCPWDETAWHEALDPNLEERVAAVDAYNKKQKAIYEKSKQDATQEAAVKDDADASDSLDVDLERRRNKRTDMDEEDEEEADYDSEDTAPIQFVPKVALSHERYVKARIQEERLPPSYTKIFARHYGLRPEAIESVFYMYRITGDDIWRQKGWKMFQAIQSATQTEVANAAMKDVTSLLGEIDDVMESFWLAETLKYFYLLFDDPQQWSLDEWVLNTEAHFLKIDK